MPRKRPAKQQRSQYGEGTVYQRPDGRWRVAVRIVDETGKKQRIHRNAKSQEHGEQIRSELLATYHTPRETHFQGTLGELLDRYFRDCVHGHLKPTTVAGYEYARGYIGDLEQADIAHIHPVDIADLIGGLKVGANTAQKVRNLLRRAFGYAINPLRLLDINPCAGVKSPSAEPAEVEVFTDEEIEKILTAVSEDRYGPLLVVCAQLGLREGEAFGLRWMDIDFENRTLRVAQNVTETGGKVTIGTPKTKSSRRTIPINSDVVTALNTRRKAALAEQRAGEEDLVFQAPNGGPISRTNFAARVWRPLLKKLKIPLRGIHALRHTAATVMLRRGVRVTTAAGMLGHKNPATLLDIYSHWIPSDLEEAAKAMEGFGAAKEPEKETG